MDLDLSYQNEKKKLYSICLTYIWKHFVKFQNKLKVIVLLWKVLYKSVFFICLTTFQWEMLPNDVDGFGLPISKLKENTLFPICETLLEAFVKFQTNWQWQLHYGKYYRNHCFVIVWQASTEHYQNMLMHFDWQYQNEENAFNSIF